ncbi:MAG: hypothetical protein MUP53_06690, partial [Bacteroidales bacterium]|nr:hypothetical protein [Bacteroidales bacterium]
AADNSKADEAPGAFKYYRLIDRDSSFRGIITSVTESSGQIMAEVTGTNGTVLIPLHPDLIISIDHRKKIIEMSLPSGLTSVND